MSKGVVLTDEHQAEGRMVPIKWHIPASTVTRYATNFVVQHTEREFIISFFETWPPIILGTPEEKMAELLKIESATAECVARIVVAAERMPDLIRILQGNLDSYHSKLGDQEVE